MHTTFDGVGHNIRPAGGSSTASWFHGKVGAHLFRNFSASTKTPLSMGLADIKRTAHEVIGDGHLQSVASELDVILLVVDIAGSLLASVPWPSSCSLPGSGLGVRTQPRGSR